MNCASLLMTEPLFNLPSIKSTTLQVRTRSVSDGHATRHEEFPAVTADPVLRAIGSVACGRNAAALGIWQAPVTENAKGLPQALL